MGRLAPGNDNSNYVIDSNGFLWDGNDIRIAANRAVDYFTGWYFQSQCIPAWNYSDLREERK